MAKLEYATSFSSSLKIQGYKRAFFYTIWLNCKIYPQIFELLLHINDRYRVVL